MSADGTIPRSIGRYAVESEVGTGGAGVVYRARDPMLDRQVAIKVPRRGALSDEQMTRMARDFYHEAAIAGRFQHPNVVTIYDVGRDGALDFMVMELVEGASGRDLLLAENQLPVWDALSIAYQCCRALDFIHYHGVVHRDIKPGNVLVSSARDRAKLLDFSVAHSIGDAPDAMCGTLAYMSPESLRKGGAVDHRSDLFGMGATLYEFLTGRRPFGSSGREVAQRILAHAPESLESIRGDVPAKVVDIVARALEKDPEDRFQSALEFADALHAARRSLGREEPARGVEASDAYVSLRRSEWFGSFAPEQVNEMLEVGAIEVHEKGDVLVREGERGDAFYLVLHGTAVVVKSRQVLSRIRTGEFFGEIALVASETRSASVVAAEPVLVWKVGKALLEQASDASRAGFYKVFLSVLVQRLEERTGESLRLRAELDAVKRASGPRE